MMVNVLLSFAQYERELAGERTRHKIEGARRRGKWTGGTPPLGYDVAPEGGKILVNRGEAAQVVAIYEMFAADPSLLRTVRELNRRGWTTKAWTTKDGRVRTGSPWSKSTLRTVLRDPLYVGKQKLGDETFDGQHDAIVPKRLWNQVQQILDRNRHDRGSSERNGQGFLLRGLLRCTACDAAMRPSWTRRHGRTYRYYTCRAARDHGHDLCPTKSVPADAVEGFVVGQIRRIGADPALQEETFSQAVALVKADARGLQAEKKRLERDRVGIATEVERLVATLTRTEGPAAEAVGAELNRVQERLATLDARLREIADRLAALREQDVDRDAVARALADFDEIWSVLLVPERERVLHLVVDRVSYDGRDGTLAIDWRLPGFAELAAGVAP
jgi:site-specific DNA recombinase